MNEEQVEEIMKLPEESSVDNNQTDGKVTVQEAHKPEDIAATFFRMEKIKFQMLLSKMAPYQLRRAIMNAVSYPFTDEEYLPETQEERDFAYLAGELMLNKTIMQLAFEQQQVEKAQQEALQNVEEVATIQEPKDGQ